MSITWPECGTDALTSIAVAIGPVGDEPTHVGLLHRRTNGPVKFLHLEEWPARPDDMIFQGSIVLQLKTSLERARRKLTIFRASPEHAREARAYERRVATLERHIAQVEEEMGCVRYRPAEVAGASALTPHPIGFEDAVAVAEAILAAFQERSAE